MTEGRSVRKLRQAVTAKVMAVSGITNKSMTFRKA
jgi:hypothetical protein